METPGVAPAMAFVATAAAVAVARSTTAAVANHVDEVSYKAAFYTAPFRAPLILETALQANGEVPPRIEALPDDAGMQDKKEK